MSKYWSVLGIVLCAVAAHAQDTASYAGKWKGELKVGDGKVTSVRVVIDGNGGSWDTDARRKTDPCVGLKSPIHVTAATADSLAFDIKASEALGGCRDSRASLQRVDEKTLKGVRGREELVLTRE